MSCTSDAPEVQVTYGNNQFICKSDANPKVADADFVIIFNDTTLYPPTKELTCADRKCILLEDIMYSTDVRCNATNQVGTGSSTTEAVPGKLLRITNFIPYLRFSEFRVLFKYQKEKWLVYIRN